jgi:hypothetical protein
LLAPKIGYQPTLQTIFVVVDVKWLALDEQAQILAAPQTGDVIVVGHHNAQA